MEPTADDGDSADPDGTEDRPQVPPGVLRAIEDLEAGNTASKDDIESVLDF